MISSPCYRRLTEQDTKETRARAKRKHLILPHKLPSVRKMLIPGNRPEKSYDGSIPIRWKVGEYKKLTYSHQELGEEGKTWKQLEGHQ